MRSHAAPLHTLSAGLLMLGLVAGCSAPAPEGHGTATSAIQDPENNDDFANAEAEVLAYQTAVRDCLTESAFPAELLGDGGVAIDVPPGQDEAFMSVDAACRERIPAPVTRVLTAEEVNVKYDLELESAACLAAAGFPEFELESRDTWVARWMAVDAGDSDVTAPDTAWSLLQGSEVEAAQEACPMPTVQDIYERLNGS